eukprot:354318-Chlamydomonas_euryale.AAC.9
MRAHVHACCMCPRALLQCKHYCDCGPKHWYSLCCIFSSVHRRISHCRLLPARCASAAVSLPGGRVGAAGPRLLCGVASHTDRRCAHRRRGSDWAVAVVGVGPAVRADGGPETRFRPRQLIAAVLQASGTAFWCSVGGSRGVQPAGAWGDRTGAQKRGGVSAVAGPVAYFTCAGG